MAIHLESPPSPPPLVDPELLKYEDLRSACTQRESDENNAFVKMVLIASMIASVVVDFFTGSFIVAAAFFLIATCVGLYMGNRFRAREYQKISDELMAEGFRFFLRSVKEPITIGNIKQLFDRYTTSLSD